VNKEMYIDILRRLRDASRRKRPEKVRTNCWFLRHDSAPEHLSILVKDFFLAKNNMTTLDHLPHSPDLAAAEFYVFHQLKSVLRQRHVCYSTDIIKNAPEELKMFHKTGYISNSFTVAGKVYSCTRRLFWRKHSLNDCTLL
jgi:hypothetical protein